MGQNDYEAKVEDQGEIYTVGCIHCNNRVFRFSQNYLVDCGRVVLICPACGQYTEVTGNGEIRNP